MKDWIINNLGKTISGIGVVMTAIGFITGLWVAQKDIKNELDKKELKIIQLEKEIRDLKDGVIWDIRQWIANPSNYR